MIKRVLFALKNNKFYCPAIKRNCVKVFPRKIVCNLVFLYFFLLLVVLIYKYTPNDIDDTKYYNITDITSEIVQTTSLENHNLIVKKYFGSRQSWKTSNLGSILFKNEDYNTYNSKNKTFVILVWKYWDWLKNRHVHNFGSKKNGNEILSHCSVKNCIFTGLNITFDTADAVLIHIMHGVIPTVKKRNKKQLWIFLNDESPRNLFSLSRNPPKLKTLANVFNWSMTYRSDSDIPVPYGRTVSLQKPVKEVVTYRAIAELIPNLEYKRPDVLVAVLISNCKASYRMNFLNELQKHINVDVYGKCSKDKKKECPGHFRSDCAVINQYYFYLVMENSMCRQYITEKVFHNAYSKGAIPILVGSSLHDCKMLLPPNSYIHSEDYLSAKDLAEKITNTFQNIKEYVSYHLWRNHFRISNEHGYFGSESYHLCRICEALNYNAEEESVYDLDDLRLFLDADLLCKNKQ